MTIRVVSAESLAVEERGRWSAIRRDDPSLASPFFSPTFTSIVAAARDDVRVAVIEDERQLLGFFPFQRGRLGAGRPVGSLLSDYHGAIVPADASWNAKELLRACGLKTWEFHRLVTSQAPFEPFHQVRHGSRQIALSDGFDAYMVGLREAHGQTIDRLSRKMRKLEREHGSIHFTLHTSDPTNLATLFQWKTDQYVSSGAVNILAHGWIREVLRLCHAAQTDDFAGLLSFVSAGGRPVAAHLGIRSGPVFHSWFQAYDPEFAQYSPGLILLLKLAEAAPQASLTTIDLGCGGYSFKRTLANRTVPLAEGLVDRPSLAATAARGRSSAKSLIRRTALAPRLRRVARLLADRR